MGDVAISWRTYACLTPFFERLGIASSHRSSQ